eukprot:g2608.t1
MGQTAVKTGSCFLRSQAIDGSCYGTDPATAEAEHKLHQRFLRLQELHRREYISHYAIYGRKIVAEIGEVYKTLVAGRNALTADEFVEYLGCLTEEEDLADGCIFKPAPGTPDLATINAMSPLPVPEVKRRQMMPLLPCVGEPGRGFGGRAGSDSALVGGSLHSNSMFHPHYTMTCGYDDDEDAPMVEPFRPPWQRRPSTQRGGPAAASARPGFRRPYLEKQLEEVRNNFNFDQRSEVSDATFMSSPEVARGHVSTTFQQAQRGAGAPRVSHELRSLGLTENAGVPERTPDVEVEVKMTSDDGGPPRRYSGGSRDYTPELFPVPQSSSEQEEYVSRTLFQEISQMHDQVSSRVAATLLKNAGSGGGNQNQTQKGQAEPPGTRTNRGFVSFNDQYNRITFCVFAADRKVVVGGTSYRMDDVKCICEGFRSPCFFEEHFAALNVSPGCLLTLVFVDGEARVDLQFSSTVIRDRVLAYLQKYLPPVVFISGDENL